MWELKGTSKAGYKVHIYDTIQHTHFFVTNCHKQFYISSNHIIQCVELVSEAALGDLKCGVLLVTYLVSSNIELDIQYNVTMSKHK